MRRPGIRWSVLCSANNNSVITRCGMLLYRVPDVARCIKSEQVFSNVGMPK